MGCDSDNLSLGEVASRYLAALSDKRRENSQQEVYHFVRWYGSERSFTKLSAHEVACYAKAVSASDADPAARMKPVKAFFAQAQKEGWCNANLGVHLKARKAKTAVRSVPSRAAPEPVHLTREGYDRLEIELDALKDKRPEIIEAIQLAAADKDFRENAPLDAAKEEHEHLVGRIMELEDTLKRAVIIEEGGDGDARGDSGEVAVGDRVLLRDVASGRELSCMLVGAREADPAQGKISSVSPIGKAVVGRCQGDEVEVQAPVGKLRYRIESVER